MSNLERPWQDHDGFSVLEVLVSFAILTLTLVMLLQIFSGGTRRFAQARDTDLSLSVARNQLAKIRAMPTLQPGSWQNQSEGGRLAIIEVRQLGLPFNQRERSIQLFMVKVTVRSNAKNSRSVILETMVVKSENRANR